MKVVLDTNVLVSGLLGSASSPCRTIIKLLENNDLTLVLSPDLLEEISLILKRPKFAKLITLTEILAFIRFIKAQSQMIHPKKSIKICRDPKDNIFLEVAQAAQCRYVVTGDQDLLILKTFGDTVICTPRDFLESRDSPDF